MTKTTLSLALLVLALWCGPGAANRSANCPFNPVVATDDPPPNPAECPLCGGDASLHVKRLTQFAEMGFDISFVELMHQL